MFSIQVFSLVVHWKISRRTGAGARQKFPMCTHHNRHCPLEKSNVTSTGNLVQDQEEGLSSQVLQTVGMLPKRIRRK